MEMGKKTINLCDILKELWDVVIKNKELWIEMGYT